MQAATSRHKNTHAYTRASLFEPPKRTTRHAKRNPPPNHHNHHTRRHNDTFSDCSLMNKKKPSQRREGVFKAAQSGKFFHHPRTEKKHTGIAIILVPKFQVSVSPWYDRGTRHTSRRKTGLQGYPARRPKPSPVPSCQCLLLRRSRGVCCGHECAPSAP